MIGRTSGVNLPSIGLGGFQTMGGTWKVGDFAPLGEQRVECFEKQGFQTFEGSAEESPAVILLTYQGSL